MLHDKFFPTPLPQLLRITLNHLEKNNFFGIPPSLFFRPLPGDPFKTYRFGQLLETPLGVAAGPHTQLSQNIVAAWLTGSRFIELKTIQALDELEISKPCIDMQDEGYNCEWSQELKIHDSFDQYLDAWIIIHILRDRLGLNLHKEPGFIFNMSVGYNMEGIMQPNVQWFLEKMVDASAELREKIESIWDIYPRVQQLEIGACLSDNVTLSTMHGCPPQEIEKIARYLLSERKLNTAVKLNPTLLGKEALIKIMQESGFETQVPDQAFEHDLKFPDALQIIRNLQKVSGEHNVHFSLKLTNTLESVNHKSVFTDQSGMMYNSGRSLHPISVNVALKLQEEFGGTLDLSFSGGAHAFNVADLTGCGLSPITICTDLLKPGGYGRMHQTIETLREAFAENNAAGTEELVARQSGVPEKPFSEQILANLRAYAAETLTHPFYRRQEIHDPNIKTRRPLGFFDCIHAPCVDTCPTGQDIPAYNHYTAAGDFQKAASIVLQTNPFPRTTGMICDHLCQQKCTRINYDQAVRIREIKRFVAENGMNNQKTAIRPDMESGKKVAIVGAGPAGLSAARFLAQAGFEVEVFESKKQPGGMVSGVIPPFRLTDEAIFADLKRIEKAGVKVHYSFDVNTKSFADLRERFRYVVVAAGAQNTSRLDIPGIDAAGVCDPLEMLHEVRKGKKAAIGPVVAIIGGGNTAMDAARTALRLVGKDGKVIIVYRRTIKEMPADLGEIKAVKEEGIEIMELTAPLRVNVENGKVAGLICNKMMLGEKDASGRRRPVAMPGSEFGLLADTIIPAVGQDMAFDFGTGDLLKAKAGSYETQIEGVYIGGDAHRGASTAINAIGDGRKIAQAIIDKEELSFQTRPLNERPFQTLEWHMEQRARRSFAINVTETSITDRFNFNLVANTLMPGEVKYEAGRCLLCDEVCSICSTVCPNMAFFTYSIKPVQTVLEKLVPENGSFAVVADKKFSIDQRFQVLHIADWCNQCGNCQTFCPSADRPYEKKPHLFINRAAFDANTEGLFLQHDEGRFTLYRKEQGTLSHLHETNTSFEYIIGNNKITLDKNNLKVKSFECAKEQQGEISLWQAAEMTILLEGAKRFFNGNETGFKQ
jgi:putative selenate reductase